MVAYCRGPYCVFADEAVALLRPAATAPGGSNWGSPTTRPEGCRWREAGGMRTIDAETLRRWLDEGLPVTVLIADAGGVIRYTQVGFEAGDEKEYEKVVREVLKLK